MGAPHVPCSTGRCCGDGYWLVEFLTISQIIRRAPAKYARAFLYTETDDNDLTYFIRYHLEVLDRALAALNEYVARKTEQGRHLESVALGLADLNHRQRALLGHALRHPNYRYTIEGASDAAWRRIPDGPRRPA